MKNIFLWCIVLLVGSLSLVGCTQTQKHEHEWESAKCTSPKTCVSCRETVGVGLGHNWIPATCTEPKICNACGLTEGEAWGHKFNVATCTIPKTCVHCGAKEGKALGHSWEEATCASPKTCRNCHWKDGEPLGHSWVEVSAYAKECEVCEKVEIDETKLPVKLGSLTPCTGVNYKSNETISDIYGNTFFEGLEIYHAFSDNQNETEYVLNRKYQTFTTQVMIHSLRDDFKVQLRIYADGKLIYESDKMTKKTEPTNISVTIENAMFLKIETRMIKGAGTVLLSDPMLNY